MTTLELIQRMESALVKQLDQVRRQLAATDPKDAEAIARLKKEERVLHNAMVFASATLLLEGLK